jgi:hypothetical protein
MVKMGECVREVHAQIIASGFEFCQLYRNGAVANSENYVKMVHSWDCGILDV